MRLNNMIIPEQYTNIGGVDMSNDVYPSYYKPFPTLKDYEKGYINRYFVQKINDLIITEVNKNKYNEISSTVYNKLSIRWIISGPKNNVYKNASGHAFTKNENIKGIELRPLTLLIQINKKHWVTGVSCSWRRQS